MYDCLGEATKGTHWQFYFCSRRAFIEIGLSNCWRQQLLLLLPTEKLANGKPRRRRRGQSGSLWFAWLAYRWARAHSHR